MPGSTKASPLATARMAASNSFSADFFKTNPAAPACKAWRKMASSSCMVRSNTRHSGAAARMARRACSPSMPGMLTSNRRTRGASSRVRRSAMAPSPASPMTVISGWFSSSIFKPARRTAWSSASKTVIWDCSGMVLNPVEGVERDNISLYEMESGIFTNTVVPRPGADSIFNEPPSMAARSCIPNSPSLPFA